MKNQAIVFAFSIIVSLLATCCEHNVRESGSGIIEQLDMRSDSMAAYAVCRDISPNSGVPMHTNEVGRYDEVFNDSNYVHWNAAEKIGISPLTDMRSHWQLRVPIVKIVSCADFFIEPLTHSRPFVVQECADMLHEIGSRFRDSLQARGGGDYRIRITSVTRTAENVRRLRRVNRNAVDSSVHQLGTTVDISYNCFVADSPEVPRSTADLKALLAEILLAMRSEGKCLVKYEKKQPCFHITAIKPRETK